jgi:eukaryotic-like serine/threonine-protein kinase
MGSDDTAATLRLGTAVRPAAVDRVGRYVVIDRLGAGGMGVVYSAYDPELDRRIAVKLVSIEAGTEAQRGRDILLREAQAMARLAHPNVIAVYDVGTIGDGVFFAMERVDGGTLRQWLAERRPWRELLAVFAQAGRGLAAAHAAGLVHRDFKPENVLMGKDGRVRVTDFGVARALENADAESSGGAPGSDSWLRPQVTRFGKVVGTPGYLAPEQFDGGVTPQTDQFSFCVSLYEALTGQRPFSGATFSEYADEVRSKRVSFPPGAGAPGFVREAVLRGLEKDPARRFPSMEGLLEALARDPRARRLRLLAGGVLVAALAVVVGRTLAVRAAEQRACTRLAGRAQTAWDQRREPIGRAFAATGRPFAADALRAVTSRLSAFSQSWGEARGAVCRKQAALPPALQVSAGACLDQSAQLMDETAALLSRADATMVQHAPQMVAQLPPPRDCLDEAVLGSAPAPPTDTGTAKAVAERRARLALAQILGIPRPEQGIAALRPIVGELERLGHRPALAEALFALGELEQKLDPRSGADATLKRAAEQALSARDDRLFARAAGRLALVLGAFLEQRGRAEDWLSLARQAHERAGRPQALGVWLDLQQLGLMVNANRPEECFQVAERALAGTRQLADPFQEAEARFLWLIGCAAPKLPVEQMVPAAERSHALYLQAFGRHHPETALALGNLAQYRWLAGDYATALTDMEQSLDALRPLGDPISISVSQDWIARILTDQGRVREALALRQEALPLLRTTPHPRSSEVEMQAALASNLRAVGQAAAALRHAREAHLPCEKADRVMAESCAWAQLALAEVLLDRGDRAQSARLAARARDGFAQAPALARLRARVERFARDAGLRLPPPAKPGG